ncbi:MAG: hypothetical protein R3Y35_05170 [Clostridia bacterium]
MAIIKCPGCGKEISNASDICIGCGYKIHEIIENQEKQQYQFIMEQAKKELENKDFLEWTEKEDLKAQNRKHLKILFVVLLLIAGAVFLTSYMEENYWKPQKVQEQINLIENTTIEVLSSYNFASVDCIANEFYENKYSVSVTIEGFGELDYDTMFEIDDLLDSTYEDLYCYIYKISDGENEYDIGSSLREVEINGELVYSEYIDNKIETYGSDYPKAGMSESNLSYTILGEPDSIVKSLDFDAKLPRYRYKIYTWGTYGQDGYCQVKVRYFRYTGDRFDEYKEYMDGYGYVDSVTYIIGTTKYTSTLSD